MCCTRGSKNPMHAVYVTVIKQLREIHRTVLVLGALMHKSKQQRDKVTCGWWSVCFRTPLVSKGVQSCTQTHTRKE